MALIKRKTLTTFSKAAEILCLGESTIREGKCGTHVLSRVPIPNSKRKNLILEEVEALKDEWITAAVKANPNLKENLSGRKLRLIA